jgi:hypothetical protein
MPTARPFARNTGAAIAGTTQIGNLAIGTPTAGFAATGLPWWNGPDEELGYVIATQVAANNQPTPPPVYTVGQAALGGIIAYILQPGDPGYDANVQKGLVAATANQSADSTWGCFCVSTGATGTALGTGAANTAAILANCATRPIAASVAAAHNGGGFNDWYLPSKDELNKLYLNRVAIGGFDTGFPTNTYWTSSQNLPCNVWIQGFIDGTTGVASQNGQYRVRAIRSFTAAPGTANVGFWRSTALTDASFIDLAEYVSRISGTTQTFADGSAALTWLNSNGFWTNYNPVITTGLVNYLDAGNINSYPGSGTTWFDISGFGYNANADIGNPSNYTSGNSNPIVFTVDGGGSFDTTVMGGFGTVNGMPNYFTPNVGLSIELWIKYSQYRGYIDTTTGTTLLLTRFNFTSVNAAAYIYISQNTTSGVRVQFFQSSSIVNTLTFGMSAGDLNSWRQIVVTSPNTVGGTIRTYKNGVAQQTSSISTVLNDFNFQDFANERAIFSGYNSISGNSQGSYAKYSIIRFYNRELSASEISQNFNAQKARFGL